MGSDGSIQVECLSFLRGTERPFPILDVLLALSEQFELEFPLVSSNYQAPLSTNDANAVTAALSMTASSPQRSQLIQEVAEKVVIDLNQKASNYLDTRQQSLQYLKKLNDTNRELTKAQGLLEKHEKELKEYIPTVGSVGTLIQQLEGRPDTPEEHSKCLIPVGALQAQALDLTAAIHASEDALRLLEDGLRSEQLGCDDYVKLVGDVGREQFVTRFLWRRVMDRLEPAGGASTASMLRPQAPQVPHSRPSGCEALMQEFPDAPPDVVADVLRNANDDLTMARTQMKALFA
ncbi:hypothetical protein STCU_00496 [Strigomonas culicis]|nr:hypothetical protein STCU_00496 [Strigomonas culicis]|eukprot:EPY36608.1 hypothetical protein STCU_00496 [Strigomonas culicis]